MEIYTWKNSGNTENYKKCMKHPIKKIPIEPYEEITEEFVQRKYYEYNQLYFAGELPPCKFRFNAMSLYYGCLGQYYGYEDMPEI